MFTIIGGDGKEYGPATVEQVRAWIAAGRANLDTKAKALGSEEWRRLGDYAEFSGDTGAPPVVGATHEVAPTLELADRASRFGGWFIDAVLSFICLLPGMLVIGTTVLFDIIRHHGNIDAVDTARAMLGALLICAGGLILLVVQIWLLTTRGQTVGKRVLGIKIVKVADDSAPGFVHAVLMRWFVPSLITFFLNLIPGGGFLFFIVDSCFVFRDDRRCVHDLIAGTKVVKA